MTLPEGDGGCQSESPPAKRLKLTEDKSVQQENDSGSSFGTQEGIFSCCDDALLLKIFSYLKPTDLLALSQCCKRTQRVVHDRTLWTYVDFRPICLSHVELHKHVEFFKQSTKLIASRGLWVNEVVSPHTSRSVPDHSEVVPTITGSLLESIFFAAPFLKTLILENHVIDSRDITWDSFPPYLEHLSLRSCHVIKLNSERSFFFEIDQELPHLKTLDVSGCLWFKTHSFFAISKCKKLEELRMADCNVSNFVPYFSLSTRFGFKSLTVVDFRRTWVSDREVSCLNKTTSLRELYLEAPSDGSELISDLAVTSFGESAEELNKMGYYLIIMDTFEGFKPSMLRVITLRKFSKVTDTSLRHCAKCIKTLERLDVTATACTQDGVLEFRSQRPDVEIESDFDLDPNSDADNT